MKKALYEVGIKEVIACYYTVAATSQEEANKKFEEWREMNNEEIGRDLMKADSEWEVEGATLVEVGDPKYADIK